MAFRSVEDGHTGADPASRRHTFASHGGSNDVRCQRNLTDVSRITIAGNEGHSQAELNNIQETKKLSLTEGQRIGNLSVPGSMSRALQESEKGSKLLRFMLRSLEGLSTASSPYVFPTQLSKN